MKADTVTKTIKDTIKVINALNQLTHALITLIGTITFLLFCIKGMIDLF